LIKKDVKITHFSADPPAAERIKQNIFSPPRPLYKSTENILNIDPSLLSSSKKNRKKRKKPEAVNLI
jgi:hypothetical protein